MIASSLKADLVQESGESSANISDWYILQELMEILRCTQEEGAQSSLVAQLHQTYFPGFSQIGGEMQQMLRQQYRFSKISRAKTGW